MPAEEQKEAGFEATTLARRALEIHTQLHGPESNQVAQDMGLLADVLDHFNDVDDNEVPRLHKQAIAIFARVQGSLSPNVAVAESNLGATYNNRAARAHAAHDLDREMANMELALPHYREAARIFRAINHVNAADQAARNVVRVESVLRQLTAAQAVASVTRG